MFPAAPFRAFFVSPMKTVRAHTLVSCFLLFLLPSGSFAQTTLNPLPTRVIGQNSTKINNLNPNLVEGREFFSPEGIALDTSSNPPALYVSDTRNNRVLGFRSAVGFANGQPADLVLGQPDLATTLASGPAQKNAPAAGMTEPSGIAVDARGNVYVVDGGNNRILRFPKPFAQSGAPAPDIAIGQPSLSTGGVNQGAANQGAVSATTLAFTNANSVLQAFVTFDPSGNLWVADAGNNRVLRFNANALGGQAASGPAADIVLGQTDFVSNGYTQGANWFASLTAFTTPTGIAFDAAGRLFVEESISSQRGRILMWQPPYFTGQAAARILGADTGNPQPPAISEFQLDPSPGGIFPIGNGIGVADTFNNRVLVFPPVEQWTSNTTFQAAVEVAGQSDFSSGTANQGLPTATASTLNLPGAAVFFNSELYIADSGNNRVVVTPQNGASFGPAARVLGQDAMNLNAPNLVEGREFDFANTSTGLSDSGIAIDLNSTPPHLYVSDPYNNRILGYKDLRNIGIGAKADLVIGQPDFQQRLTNYPANDANTPNASGLSIPIGLAVDPNGNLYVADTGNGRVLRFPQPFSNYTPGTAEQADLVLGQLSFTSAKIPDATDRTMAAPYGLAFTLAGGLLVSDVVLNRVLYFAGPLADLASGMAASVVFGQPGFASSGGGSGPGQLNQPRHIATDSDDRLYVADSANARVSIFNHAPTAEPGAAAAQFLTNGLSSPFGIYVNGVNGEIWVADYARTQAIRYPAFNQFVAGGGAPNGSIGDNGRPVALAEDGWGNLFLADAVNRVLTYYPGLGAINAANFLSRNVLAPGMIGALFSQGNYNQFGGRPTQSSSLPLPTTLNGLQVLFNGSPVPLFYADPNQINFQVPMAAPQSGILDMQVLETATGRLLGDTAVSMQPAVPGLFTQTGDGIGTAVALNQDNTLNGPFNQAAQGTVVQLFGTGQGFISGAPPDGTVSNAPLPTAQPPMVIVGTDFVPSANIQYAGLSPGLVGVWQINVLIPDTVITTPTNPTQVIVLQNNVPSGGGGIGRFVQIYVKPRN